MKTKNKPLLIVLITALSITQSYSQSDFKRWSIQPSLVHMNLSAATSSVNVGGMDLPGDDNVTFTNDNTFGILIDFYLTKNISLHTALAVPPNTEATGQNNLEGASAGKLAFGPAPLLAVYHFYLGKFQPFIGGGLSYVVIFDIEEQDITDVEVNPKLGTMFRAGFDYMITDRFGFGASVQKAFAKAEMTGMAPAGPDAFAPAVVEGRLDPLLITIGGVIRL